MRSMYAKLEESVQAQQNVQVLRVRAHSSLSPEAAHLECSPVLNGVLPDP